MERYYIKQITATGEKVGFSEISFQDGALPSHPGQDTHVGPPRMKTTPQEGQGGEQRHEPSQPDRLPLVRRQQLEYQVLYIQVHVKRF